MPEASVPRIFDRALIARRRRRGLAVGTVPGFLAKVAADDIALRLSAITRPFAEVMVLGAAGSPLPDLMATRPGTARVIACDEVEAPGIDRVFDHESPALAPASADCILWPLGLERVNDVPGCLAWLARALRPDGLFMAVLMAGSSLSELREAWMRGEAEMRGGASPRIAPFADVRDLGGLLQRAGLALPVADLDRLTVRYASSLELMRDLKAMGLANGLTERSRTLTSPALLARAASLYDRDFSDGDGRVRATFELATLTAWAPHLSQPRPLKPGSARMRLADALGADEKKLSPNS
jgi:hypothetical protein